jgi:hypothetical protein
MSSPKITLHGREVTALSGAQLARICLCSDTTVARWRASGKLKPAQGSGGAGGQTTYYFADDIAQLRADNLAEIRAKVGVAGLTTEERGALLVAGLQDIVAGLERVQEMFKKVVAAEAAKKAKAAH